MLGNDSFSLQELLGHEDMTTVNNYMHMNDETIQPQKRKYSPGDHLPSRMPGPRETRRRGYRTRGKEARRVNDEEPGCVLVQRNATRQMLSSRGFRQGRLLLANGGGSSDRFLW